MLPCEVTINLSFNKKTAAKLKGWTISEEFNSIPLSIYLFTFPTEPVSFKFFFCSFLPLEWNNFMTARHSLLNLWVWTTDFCIIKQVCWPLSYAASLILSIFLSSFISDHWLTFSFFFKSALLRDRWRALSLRFASYVRKPTFPYPNPDKCTFSTLYLHNVAVAYPKLHYHR